MKLKTIRLLGVLIAVLGVSGLIVHASRLYEREVHQNDYLKHTVAKLEKVQQQLELRIWRLHKK